MTAERVPPALSAASVGRYPLGGGVAVLDGGGKLMLGRKPVIQGYHHGSGPPRNCPADGVVRIQIAQYPAAAVEVQQAGERALRRRSKNANWDGTLWVRNPEVLHAADLLRRSGDGFQTVHRRHTRLRRGKRLDGRRALRLVCLEQRPDFRIELVAKLQKPAA